MRENRPKKRTAVIAIIVALAIVLGVGVGVVVATNMGGGMSPGGASDSMPVGGGSASGSVSGDDPSGGGSAPGGGAQPDSSTPQAPPKVEPPEDVTPRAYTAIAPPEEMRAMWISFLEWKETDFSTEETLRAAFGQMLDNCAGLGLNTAIVAVRPFGDAYYPSAYYPWSDLLTGTQGADPGYDPLAVMIEEAHARGLRLEAWINPYRVKDTKNGPETLSANNPAVVNPGWVRDVDGNLWYDPGLPEVREQIVNGVLEIVQGYDVDGIHFDDYFYPEFTAAQKEAGTDIAFDEASYTQYGGGMGLGEWRRQNVSQMVQAVYAAVKAANPTASFGISVQGNNDNNYNTMHCDVRQWLAWDGYIDYIMPQLYWGFDYLTASGRDTYAFKRIAAEWAFYPRADSVRL